MSPFLACSPSLIISGLAPMKSSWISWKWVAGEEGAWNAFHQAGKLKKHFGYQALADLACACLIFRFFHSFSSTFIFSFTTFLIEQSEAWPEVTPSLWCVLATGNLESLLDCFIKTASSVWLNLITGISTVLRSATQKFCFSDFAF